MERRLLAAFLNSSVRVFLPVVFAPAAPIVHARSARQIQTETKRARVIGEVRGAGADSFVWFLFVLFSGL